jgi:hypothetical protein
MPSAMPSSLAYWCHLGPDQLGNYFWPIWPALVWGIALAIHAWTVYGQRPITDADIDRELSRDHRPDQPTGG